MALAYTEIVSDGNANQNLSFSFDYLAVDHISVYVDGVLQNRPTDWDFLDSVTIDFVSHPAAGAIIRIQRTTPATARNVDFQDGSVLSEKDLDDSARQIFFVAQEANDTANEAMTRDGTGNFVAQVGGIDRRVTGVADPIDSQDAATKNFVLTQTASDLAQVQQARTDAQTYASNANTALTDAQQAVSDAQAAQGAAETARDNAQNAESNASGYASDALGYLQAASFPATLTSYADYFLQVKDDETGYELVASVASPQFYGFNLDASGNLVLDYGKLDVNVDDYASYYIGENISFSIVNNNLVMTY